MERMAEDIGPFNGFFLTIFFLELQPSSPVVDVNRLKILFLLFAISMEDSALILLLSCFMLFYFCWFPPFQG